MSTAADPLTMAVVVDQPITTTDSTEQTQTPQADDQQQQQSQQNKSFSQPEAMLVEETVETEPGQKGQPYEWYLKDKLALMSAVVAYEENWSIIDEQMQQYAEVITEIERDDDEVLWRPEGWNSHENCVKEYNRLIEAHKATSTSVQPEGTQLTSSLSAAETILRRLEDERAEELDAEITQDVLEYKARLDDIRRLETGDFGHVMEVFGQNESFKRFLISEGMQEKLDLVMQDYYQWQQLTPEEKAAQAAASTPLPVKTHEESVMAPPSTPTQAIGGPSSPKVSPQLKNLVYTAIAGTQEEVSNLPAPASSPTLSMLLEMPPRGHGQPLPEIPTVTASTGGTRPKTPPPSEAVAAATVSTKGDAKTPEKVEGDRTTTESAVGGVDTEMVDMERDVDIKLEGNVQISPLKRPTQEAEQGTSISVEGATPIKTEPSEERVAESDSDTTVSTTPTSQRGAASVHGSPAAATGTPPRSTRPTRRTAQTSETTSLEEGKSLRGRTIITTPTKEETASSGSGTKEKVRIKLEFDASTKTLKKPTPVDFKTVSMKEKERESERRDLRSRRTIGSPTLTPQQQQQQASKQHSTRGSKKDQVSDDDEFLDARSELSSGKPDDHELQESSARATERWVEEAGDSTTKPSKQASTPAAPTAAAAVGRKRRGDSTDEKPTPPTAAEKEAEEKRVTRARAHRGGPTTATALASTPTTTAKTMTPPPSLTPASGASTPTSSATPARGTPEPESSSSTGPPSRGLRSRHRLHDKESFEPASPAVYSTPHSPASSTVSAAALLDDSSSASVGGGGGGGPSSSEDKNMKRALLSLHRLVTNLKNAYIFLKASVPKPCKDKFEKYVRRPLDFSMIKRAIEHDTIRTFEAYQQQVCIMFMNHVMYFNDDSELNKQTRRMAAETFDIIEDFIRNFNESNTAGGPGLKRESRGRDLRHSYTTPAGLKKSAQSTPTPSVVDSEPTPHPSGSEGGGSHDDSAAAAAGGAGAAVEKPKGQRGRKKKLRVELSPSITDEPRVTRTPRPPPPPPTGKTRHSAV